jgi:hypothetical protein
MKSLDQKKELQHLIIEKAMKDMQFREQLLRNPGDTIEAELGFKLPSTLRLTVLEEKPDTFFLVLPHADAEGTDRELSEAELETVAGGYNVWSNDSDCFTCDKGGGCAY